MRLFSSYILFDWFNKLYNIPFNQSACSTHEIKSSLGLLSHSGYIIYSVSKLYHHIEWSFDLYFTRDMVMYVAIVQPGKFKGGYLMVSTVI